MPRSTLTDQTAACCQHRAPTVTSHTCSFLPHSRQTLLGRGHWMATTHTRAIAEVDQCLSNQCAFLLNEFTSPLKSVTDNPLSLKPTETSILSIHLQPLQSGSVSHPFSSFPSHSYRQTLIHQKKCVSDGEIKDISCSFS